MSCDKRQQIISPACPKVSWPEAQERLKENTSQSWPKWLWHELHETSGCCSRRSFYKFLNSRTYCVFPAWSQFLLSEFNKDMKGPADLLCVSLVRWFLDCICYLDEHHTTLWQ